VLAASYEAKSFGVSSGMSGRRAREVPADKDQLWTQLRVEQLLDRCIEGIEVSVEDGGCCLHPDRPPAKFGSWSIVIVTIGYTAPDNAGQVDL
jgi:hypothetical protein